MDRSLIEKIKHGDQRSFKLLYEEHADYALRTAYMITKNTHDASDIVQETFLRVYRNIHKYDPNRPFKGWFYKILVRECYRLLERKKKYRYDQDIEETNIPFIDEQLYDLELDEMLNGLNEKNRMAVVLKYIHGFSEKEISIMLGEKHNTIKSRLFQGRKKLKEKWGREFIE